MPADHRPGRRRHRPERRQLLLRPHHPQPRLVGLELDPGADRRPPPPARRHHTTPCPTPASCRRIALERVEVLAEGASPIYGSDAVAGVVNFITRRRFDGVQATGQAGFGDGYRTYAAGLLAGSTWDTGSVMVALGYSPAPRRSSSTTPTAPSCSRDQRAGAAPTSSASTASPATIQPQRRWQRLSCRRRRPRPWPTPRANAPCDTPVYGERIGPKRPATTPWCKVEQQVGEQADRRSATSSTTTGARSPRSTRAAPSRPRSFRTGAAGQPLLRQPARRPPGTAAGDRQTIRWHGRRAARPRRLHPQPGPDLVSPRQRRVQASTTTSASPCSALGRRGPHLAGVGQAPCARAAPTWR